MTANQVIPHVSFTLQNICEFFQVKMEHHPNLANTSYMHIIHRMLQQYTLLLTFQNQFVFGEGNDENYLSWEQAMEEHDNFPGKLFLLEKSEKTTSNQDENERSLFPQLMEIEMAGGQYQVVKIHCHVNLYKKKIL